MSTHNPCMPTVIPLSTPWWLRAWDAVCIFLMGQPCLSRRELARALAGLDARTREDIGLPPLDADARDGARWLLRDGSRW